MMRYKPVGNLDQEDAHLKYPKRSGEVSIIFVLGEHLNHLGGAAMSNVGSISCSEDTVCKVARICKDIISHN